MTSAQNHLPQLSGNNYYIGFLLLLFFFITSCSSSSEAIRRDRPKVPKERTKVRKQRPSKVDTVKWTEISPDTYKPIENSAGPLVDKRESYGIGLLLPFNTNKSTDEGTASNRFIQFYGGMQMAMDDLIDDGMQLTLIALDSEENQNTVKDKLQRIEEQVHVVIGPYTREGLSAAAKWGKENKIPVVSPWVASSRIAENNPFYIQLRPSVRDHYNRIVEDVLKNYSPEQVIILKEYEGKDDGKVAYIQEYASTVLNLTDKNPFQEFAIEADSLILSETYMSDIFIEGKETVFISQNYLFEEDEFVYNTIRKISAVKGDRKATLYGMPIIMDMDKIDFGLYKLLNIKVARSKYVDLNNNKVQVFRNTFLSRYGILPSDEAFFGYDVGYFFGQTLNKYGVTFQYFLDQADINLLQSKFDIQKTFQGDKVSDDFRDINIFANKHLDIIEFKNNRFVVNREK